jgi:helicase MOV-10
VSLTHNRILTFSTPILPVIRFSQSYRGRYEDRIEIIFEDNKLNKQFVITRSMRVIVGDKADHELLRPTTPYIPRKRTQRQAENEVIPGELPPALKAVPYIVNLTKAPIPRQVSSTLSTGSTSEIIRNVRRILLPSVLDSEAYGRHFKNLLWIEENQME